MELFLTGVSVPSSTFVPNRALTDEDRELRRRTTDLKRSTHIIQATQSRGFRHHNRQLDSQDQHLSNSNMKCTAINVRTEATIHDEGLRVTRT